MAVLSTLILLLFSSNLVFLQAQNAIFRKIEMHEDIKQEAALKVLDFSEDVDHTTDESGNYTAAFVSLDKACSFLLPNKILSNY